MKYDYHPPQHIIFKFEPRFEFLSLGLHTELRNLNDDASYTCCQLRQKLPSCNQCEKPFSVFNEICVQFTLTYDTIRNVYSVQTLLCPTYITLLTIPWKSPPMQYFEYCNIPTWCRSMHGQGHAGPVCPWCPMSIHGSCEPNTYFIECTEWLFIHNYSLYNYTSFCHRCHMAHRILTMASLTNRYYIRITSLK